MTNEVHQATTSSQQTCPSFCSSCSSWPSLFYSSSSCPASCHHVALMALPSPAHAFRPAVWKFWPDALSWEVFSSNFAPAPTRPVLVSVPQATTARLNIVSFENPAAPTANAPWTMQVPPRLPPHHHSWTASPWFASVDAASRPESHAFPARHTHTHTRTRTRIQNG